MKEQKFRKLAVILAAVMSVGLASCGDSDSSKADKDSKASEETSSAAAVSDSSTAAAVESKSEGGDVTTPADSSKAEELVTQATKSAAEVVAEIPAAEVKSAKLKKLGKLKDTDVEFYDDFIYKEKGENKIEILDYQGKAFSDKNACYVDKLGNTGIYSFQIDGSDILYDGLCDAQGNVIVDASAKVGIFDEIDDRYLKAYIPDKETKDKNEAIYYATNRRWSVEVQDEDIMYTGTVKIYDTVNRKFIESSAENFDPHYLIHGDIVSYYDADSNIKYVSLESDTVLDLGTMEPVGRALLTEYKSDGNTYCYDRNKTLLFVVPYTINEFDSGSEFLSAYDSKSGMRGVIHESGAVMIEPKYKTLNNLGGGYFSYYNDDFSKMGLVKADGTEVLPCEYKNILDIKTPGYFCVQGQDGKYSIVDTTGKEIVGGQDYSLNEGGYIKDGDSYKFLVVGKGDVSLKLDSIGTYLGNFLLFDNKTNAVYDLVTGEKVLEKADRVHTAYGYLYVESGKDITIYEIDK